MNPRWCAYAYFAGIYLRGYQAVAVFHWLGMGIRLSDVVLLGFVAGGTQAMGTLLMKRWLRAIVKCDARRYVMVLQIGAGFMIISNALMIVAESITLVAAALAAMGFGLSCALGPYYELVRHSAADPNERAIAMADCSMDVLVIFLIGTSLGSFAGGLAYGLCAVSPKAILGAQIVVSTSAALVVLPLRRLQLFPLASETNGITDRPPGMERAKWTTVLVAASNAIAFSMFIPMALQLKAGHLFTTAFAMPCYMAVVSIYAVGVRMAKVSTKWTLAVPWMATTCGVAIVALVPGVAKLIGLNVIAFADYCNTAIIGGIIGKQPSKNSDMMDIMIRDAVLCVGMGLLCRWFLSVGVAVIQATLLLDGLLVVVIGVLVLSLKRSKCFHWQK